MIPTELQNDLNALAEILLPEFAGGIYWLAADELPEAQRVTQCWGFTGRHLDISVRDSIGDRWQGRRPCVVLDLKRIERALQCEGYFSPAIMSLAIQGYVIGVAIHELAHVADDGFDASPLDERLANRATANHEYSVAYYADAKDIADDKPPWFLHDPNWLRVVTHAVHRTRAAGYHFPDSSVWDRDNATCPLLHTATGNLHDELHELHHVPLSKLNTYAPPTDYAGLWRCKTSRWLESRPADDPDDARHVREAMNYFQGIQT